MLKEYCCKKKTSVWLVETCGSSQYVFLIKTKELQESKKALRQAKLNAIISLLCIAQVNHGSDTKCLSSNCILLYPSEFQLRWSLFFPNSGPSPTHDVNDGLGLYGYIC